MRWIGIGITVAAAATMLLADVALAASSDAAGRQPPATNARVGGLQAAMPHGFPSTPGRTSDGPVTYRRAVQPVTTIVDAGPWTGYQQKTFVHLD
ncbi:MULTISPECIES: hypothetical protein [unclassified Paracoccus (in: a-proteobacteria)]|uniref:hypothetical protein n=1 Tax=unclassified Paracoccus (in: a-proteobacteria) TaxID=2688777 RepID=UPI001601F7E7|nr:MULTISPECIES: hypothetical protein [unclassified Paracoccus (in: a-proteobacteria)]MBB1492388.1 hypothetical protein [Paracoccus sp. MC1854]QQO45417.1 hypothetical protein JGR78_03410 [Paracoccus sp. MC1862]